MTADEPAKPRGERENSRGTPPWSRRRRVIVGVCVLVVVLVLAIAFGGGDTPTPQSTATQPTQTVAPAGAVPLPRDLPQGPPALSTQDRDAARRAARTFARDFLAFQRGVRTPAEIRFATAQVRELIAALPRGRGTPAVRQHPARLAGISLRAGDRADTIVATATITRLGARFPFRFTLRKTNERWRVVAAQLG
ncbi:MAG TPA: hypothetical protein VGO80_11900 [Solirubrobacteraceae bacterium]|nr:hypothetical protein [Solirubrobacteraceae bacterium]